MKKKFYEITKQMQDLLDKEMSVSKGVDKMKYQGKTIKKRKDGRYWARYYDNNKQKSVYGKTEKECYNNLKKALKNKKQNNKNISNNKKAHEWLDFWYKTYKEPNNRSSDNEIIIRLHLKTNLPNILIAKLTPDIIQEALNKIQSLDRRRKAFNILNASLKQAYINDFIKTNPMDKLKNITCKKNKGKALSIEEEQIFLDKIKGNEFENFYKICLLTGSRRGEALKLNINDIDFENKTIHLRGTKTKTSDRIIPLFENVKLILHTLEPNEKGYYFNYNKDTVTKKFKKICPKHKLHDLRHTFATRCLENKIPMRIVQQWLGHSDYQTTANIYSTVFTDFQIQQATIIDTYFDTYFNNNK